MAEDGRIDAATGGSRLVGALREALEHSFVGRLLGVGDHDSLVESWYRSSVLGRSVERLRTFAERATVVRASNQGASALTALTEQSFLYRWLTTEPDHDPIVIDLRETRTVGPLLAVVERIAVVVLPAVRGSWAVRAASAVDTAIEERPVRTMSYFVLAATAANGLATAAAGMLTETGIYLRAGLVAVALLGTRSTASLDDLAETRTWRLLRLLIEPPPPEDEDDG